MNGCLPLFLLLLSISFSEGIIKIVTILPEEDEVGTSTRHAKVEQASSKLAPGASKGFTDGPGRKSSIRPVDASTASIRPKHETTPDLGSTADPFDASSVRSTGISKKSHTNPVIPVRSSPLPHHKVSGRSTTKEESSNPSTNPPNPHIHQGSTEEPEHKSDLSSKSPGGHENTPRQEEHRSTSDVRNTSGHRTVLPFTSVSRFRGYSYHPVVSSHPLVLSSLLPEGNQTAPPKESTKHSGATNRDGKHSTRDNRVTKAVTGHAEADDRTETSHRGSADPVSQGPQETRSSSHPKVTDTPSMGSPKVPLVPVTEIQDHTSKVPSASEEPVSQTSQGAYPSITDDDQSSKNPAELSTTNPSTDFEISSTKRKKEAITVDKASQRTESSTDHEENASTNSAEESTVHPVTDGERIEPVSTQEHQGFQTTEEKSTAATTTEGQGSSEIVPEEAHSLASPETTVEPIATNGLETDGPTTIKTDADESLLTKKLTTEYSSTGESEATLENDDNNSSQSSTDATEPITESHSSVKSDDRSSATPGKDSTVVVGLSTEPSLEPLTGSTDDAEASEASSISSDGTSESSTGPPEASTIYSQPFTEGPINTEEPTETPTERSQNPKEASTEETTNAPQEPTTEATANSDGATDGPSSPTSAEIPTKELSKTTTEATKGPFGTESSKKLTKVQTTELSTVPYSSKRPEYPTTEDHTEISTENPNRSSANPTEEPTTTSKRPRTKKTTHPTSTKHTTQPIPYVRPGKAALENLYRVFDPVSLDRTYFIGRNKSRVRNGKSSYMFDGVLGSVVRNSAFRGNLRQKCPNLRPVYLSDRQGQHYLTTSKHLGSKKDPIFFCAPRHGYCGATIDVQGYHSVVVNKKKENATATIFSTDDAELDIADKRDFLFDHTLCYIWQTKTRSGPVLASLTNVDYNDLHEHLVPYYLHNVQDQQEYVSSKLYNPHLVHKAFDVVGVEAFKRKVWELCPLLRPLYQTRQEDIYVLSLDRCAPNGIGCHLLGYVNKRPGAYCGANTPISTKRHQIKYVEEDGFSAHFWTW